MYDVFVVISCVERMLMTEAFWWRQAHLMTLIKVTKEKKVI